MSTAEAFKCDECGTSYNSQRELEDHNKNEHHQE
ncbi:MAG: C2H2-type zinc finger protein [Nitrososphaeraceae archaeon]